jgi:hypothetical protein
MVRGGTHTADAGHDHRHLLGRGALHEIAETAHFDRLEVGGHHLAFLDLHFNAGMAFNPAEGKSEDGIL